MGLAINIAGTRYDVVPELTPHTCKGCVFYTDGVEQPLCKEAQASSNGCKSVIFLKPKVKIVEMRPPKVVLDDRPYQTKTLPEPMTQIDTILTERGNRYGEFDVNSSIAQELKAVMRDASNWRDNKLTPDMREALEMIAHKIARILSGDCFYKDSWLDIEGYAKLVSKTLRD